MKCDLHIHSSFSDGTDTPNIIIDKASASGIDCISLTEHDALFGASLCDNEWIDYASSKGVGLVRGIEVSTRDSKTGLKTHILAYWPEYGSFSFKQLKTLINKTRQMRNQIAQLQIDQLRARGITIEYNRVLSNTKDGQIFKKHVLEQIERTSKNAKEKELIFQLFKRGQCCYFRKEYPDTQDIIDAIVADGGMPVLAHPVYSKNVDQVDRYVKMGIRGIEYIHPTHQKTDRKEIKNIACHYNLVLTGGSDYHGFNYRIGELGLYFIKGSIASDFLISIKGNPM